MSTNSELSEKKIRKVIPFTIAPTIIKYLAINFGEGNGTPLHHRLRTEVQIPAQYIPRPSGVLILVGEGVALVCSRGGERRGTLVTCSTHLWSVLPGNFPGKKCRKASGFTEDT